MYRRIRIWIAAGVLILVHAAVILSGFLSPYPPSQQNRDFPFVPPSGLHFRDAGGHWRLRPFVYRLEPAGADASGAREDPSSTSPVRFWVRGAPWRVAGVFTSDRHLIGVDPGSHLFLLGTDGYGRDQFSRLLEGGKISLAAGLLAAFLSLALGLMFGSVAGFYGGWADSLVMRGVDLFLALPWLYLLLAVRAFLPLEISPERAFLMLIAIVGAVGWARPARMIRGVVLSAKERPYVAAARGFGASDFYLLRRHVLPQAWGVILTQAALLVPQYVLAEVSLSYLGLGVGEPAPSWGNLLGALQRYEVLASYWWMFLPGLALVLVFIGYQVLADSLHEHAKVMQL